MHILQQLILSTHAQGIKITGEGMNWDAKTLKTPKANKVNQLRDSYRVIF